MSIRAESLESFAGQLAGWIDAQMQPRPISGQPEQGPYEAANSGGG